MASCVAEILTSPSSVQSVTVNKRPRSNDNEHGLGSNRKRVKTESKRKEDKRLDFVRDHSLYNSLDCYNSAQNAALHTKSKSFSLACEPNPLQRKSYNNERRYLLPNPLEVRFTGSPDAVLVGTVEVFLVDDCGALFPKEMQDMLEGIKLKPFDEQNRAAFSLLMRTISGDMNLRLKFVVRYRFKVPPRSPSSASTALSSSAAAAAGTLAQTSPDKNPAAAAAADSGSLQEEYTEEFVSTPFRVESNRKKLVSDHPCLRSIEPSEGPRNVGEEVSLHGTNFGDGKNLRVRFGDYPVSVVRVENDTIKTVAPKRPDLPPNTRVSVQVGYFHPTRGVIWCSETLDYTYLADKAFDCAAPSTVPSSPIKQSSFVFRTLSPYPLSSSLILSESLTASQQGGVSLNDLVAAALLDHSQDSSVDEAKDAKPIQTEEQDIKKTESLC